VNIKIEMKKKTKIAIISVLLLFILIKGLFWLAILLILLLATYKLIVWSISHIKIVFIRKLLKGFISFVFIFSIAIGIKLLAFDIYKIPSSSMEKTLFPGDVIVVNKLKYGPRLPQSPFQIPWVNIAFYFNDYARSKMKASWWGFKRLSGMQDVKQGDVFVFNLGLYKDFFVVKRCVGLPGDNFEMRDGRIFTNNQLFEEPDAVRNTYQFSVKNRELFYRKIDSLKIQEGIRRVDRKRHLMEGTFSKKDFEKIKKIKAVTSTEQRIDTFDISKEIVKNSKRDRWTLDNLGPVQIPKKGMVIPMNAETHYLYGKILKQFEKCIITKKSGTYFVNEKEITNYTFKQNYYFMMGDNRKGTIDSRAWGFLPESNIIGKVQCVLFSNQYGEFQWNRIFKKLD